MGKSGDSKISFNVLSREPLKGQGFHNDQLNPSIARGCVCVGEEDRNPLILPNSTMKSPSINF